MSHTIGLIGCGGISSVWIDAVNLTPDCRIAMTYDVDAATATKKAEEIGAQPVVSLDDLLASADIDTVIIGTPTFTHADLAVAAARAGKHIMCEKPMSLKLSECQRMIDACAAGGVKMAIGHSLRFWGAFLKVRELVADGIIGTPVFGQIHRMGPSALLPATLEAKTDQAHWRSDTQYSGGSILEGFIHELDFSRTIFGDVTSVYCEATGRQPYGEHMSPMTLQAMIQYEAGKTATLRMGQTVGFNWNGSRICGTTGTLAFDAWDGPVRYYTPDAEEPEIFECENTLAYALELQDLLKAVGSGNEPENSGINGKKNVGLCLAMYQSMAQGTRFLFEDGLPVGISADYQYRGLNSILY